MQATPPVLSLISIRGSGMPLRSTGRYETIQLCREMTDTRGQGNNANRRYLMRATIESTRCEMFSIEF